MELSKRLNCIVNNVDRCENLIDVGTDHGYVPIYLVKNKILNSAIASDINKGPVEKAEFNVRLDGLNDFISVRLGPGLKTVKNFEVQSAVIAGMGGHLTKDILLDDIEKVKNMKFLILQPAQNPEVLREFLYKNNFEIINEDICYDEGKYYELFKVKYSESKEKIKIEDDIFYEISPVLLNKKSELINEFLEFKIKKYEDIIKYIKDDTEGAKNRKEELILRVEKIKEIKERF